LIQQSTSYSRCHDNQVTKADDNFDINKKMGLGEEDKILIKNLYYAKGCDAFRLMNELPGKGCKINTLINQTFKIIIICNVH